MIKKVFYIIHACFYADSTILMVIIISVDSLPKCRSRISNQLIPISLQVTEYFIYIICFDSELRGKYRDKSSRSGRYLTNDAWSTNQVIYQLRRATLTMRRYVLPSNFIRFKFLWFSLFFFWKTIAYCSSSTLLCNVSMS